MTRRFAFILLLLACFIAGVLLAGRFRDATDAGVHAQSPARPGITAPAPVSATTTLTDFSRIAERPIPAVVNVSAQQVVRRRVVDPFFSLFGDPDDVLGSRRGVENSLGSG